MSPTDVWGVTSYPEYALLQFQELDCVSLFSLSSWASGFHQRDAAVSFMAFPFLFLLPIPSRSSVKSSFTTGWDYQRAEGLSHSTARCHRQTELDVGLWGLLFLKHLRKEKLKQETGTDVPYKRKPSTNNTHYPVSLHYFIYLNSILFFYFISF